jgi:hypothetical protein
MKIALGVSFINSIVTKWTDGSTKMYKHTDNRFKLIDDELNRKLRRIGEEIKEDINSKRYSV